MDEPFGRQPKPVTISIEGDKVDCEYWLKQFMRKAEFKGDMVQRVGVAEFSTCFKIFPRAVND